MENRLHKEQSRTNNRYIGLSIHEVFDALCVEIFTVAFLGCTELAKYRTLQEEQKTNTAPI